jgi:serine/threonine protein kinase
MGNIIRWHKIEEIGSGGQGKVYRVYDHEKFMVDKALLSDVRYSLQRLSALQYVKETEGEDFQKFRDAIVQMVMNQDPLNSYALKELHKPADARDSARALERIRMEIEAMEKVSHPNLLRVFDHDAVSWFVSPYYHRGTLAKNGRRFVGDLVGSLKAIRPMVEGVGELHKKAWVHRDIKPENVFVDDQDNLILGDFGLVFFADFGRTRISDTWENVGSRDWMPAWAMGMRIEEIRPNFDVFCLGKLLWSMIAGNPLLRLWYYNRPDFDLTKRFPQTRYMYLANALFEKCIVENPGDCLSDATKLLEEVDKILSIIESNADLIDKAPERRCRVCGVGIYQPIGDVGVEVFGGRNVKYCSCTNCKHIQFFESGHPEGPAVVRAPRGLR